MNNRLPIQSSGNTWKRNTDSQSMMTWTKSIGKVSMEPSQRAQSRKDNICQIHPQLVTNPNVPVQTKQNQLQHMSGLCRR